MVKSNKRKPDKHRNLDFTHRTSFVCQPSVIFFFFGKRDRHGKLILQISWISIT